MLVITTPEADLNLLTAAELRAAVGLSAGDSSKDATLTPIGLRVAAAITTACNIAIGSGGPPTLLQETLTETWRGVSADRLVLSRRHDILITSVTVDDTALDAADYEVDAESGLLGRLSGDLPCRWSGNKIVVVYEAGFASDAIPADLRGAAEDLVRIFYYEGQRDPMLKGESVDVPGVEARRQDYWVGGVGSGRGTMPEHILARLARFMNVQVW